VVEENLSLRPCGYPQGVWRNQINLCLITLFVSHHIALHVVGSGIRVARQPASYLALPFLMPLLRYCSQSALRALVARSLVTGARLVAINQDANFRPLMLHAAHDLVEIKLGRLADFLKVRINEFFFGEHLAADSKLRNESR